jgi:hypothetical protein
LLVEDKGSSGEIIIDGFYVFVLFFIAYLIGSIIPTGFPNWSVVDGFFYWLINGFYTIFHDRTFGIFPSIINMWENPIIF